MPRYISKTKRLLAHEGRVVEADTEFTTVFPKIMVGGELVDMKLGDSLALVGYTEAEEAAMADTNAPVKAGPVSRAKA